MNRRSLREPQHRRRREPVEQRARRQRARSLQQIESFGSAGPRRDNSIDWQASAYFFFARIFFWFARIDFWVFSIFAWFAITRSSFFWFAVIFVWLAITVF